MLKKLTLAAALLASITSYGQNASFCGSIPFEQEINNRTDISESEKARLIAEHEQMEEAVAKRASVIYAERNNKDEVVYVIPVVFHVFHKFGPENISKANIDDCLRAMNEEFTGTNPRLSEVRAEFKDIVGNAHIEFRLASRDPQGNCTNGVERIYYPNTYFTTQGAAAAIKPLYDWPSNKYMNCYVVGSIESSNGGRTLGFATFPGGNAASDGLVMVYDGIGALPPSNQQNQSVATHEVGHWLGLPHTFGNGQVGSATNCNGNNDGIADTPPTIGSFSVCNLDEASCGTLANVQNFMDYSFCYCMFTAGQAAKVRSTMETVAVRKSLWQPDNIVATGANYPIGVPPQELCKAEFIPSTYSEICPGSSVKFTDYSYANVKSWKWTFDGGTPATSTEQNPTVVYNTPGYYKVTLEVSDDNFKVSTVDDSLVYVVANNNLTIPYKQPFTSSVTLAPDYKVNNPNNDKTWEINSSVGLGDSKSIWIQNRSITGTLKLDELVSNTIDLSNVDSPILKFNYAYTRKSSNSSDELNIWTSTDCGQTWTKRKSLKGSVLKTGAADVATGDFVPTADEWKSTEVSLNSAKSAGARIKIEWINSAGNNIYLDNMYIGKADGVDETLAASLNLGLFPNPAEQSSQLSFDLNKSSNVKVEMFDLLGKNVRTIQSGSLAIGNHQFDINRDQLNTGIYFVKVTVDNQQFTKKVIFK